MKTKTAGRVGSHRSSERVGEKKLAAPVTLFAAIEAAQHEALREIAFRERRSLADVVRDALAAYLATHRTKAPRRRLISTRR
jgi:hypothetical protein